MADSNPNSIDSAEFQETYKAISIAMTSKVDNEDEDSYDGLFYKILSEFQKDFNSGGYSNEQVAIARSQFYSSAYNTIESQAVNATLHILDSKASENLVNAKIALTEREKEGFDDGLRIKQAEFNGQVASFAINANASNAQEVLDRFNASIDNIILDRHFGVVVLNDIESTDTSVSGYIDSNFVKEGDLVTVTANSTDSSPVPVNDAGRFEAVVDTANLITSQTVTASITIQDSNGVQLAITGNKVVS